MRNFAADQHLEFDVKDRELQSFLEEAEEDSLSGAPLGGSEPIIFHERVGAWGNLIVPEGLNLWTALPKTGKSALVCHLFACAKRGDAECLGKPLSYRWNKLIISGADMAQEQWGKILHREGLGRFVEGTDDMPPHLIDCEHVRLWSSEKPLSFSKASLARLAEQCNEHPGSLVVIDALRNHVSNDWDENRASAARPLKDLQRALAGTNSTLVVIHHSNKSSGGRGAIQAASGSTALTGAADCCLALSFRTDEDDVIREDRTVVISSTGRLPSDSVMGELTSEGLGQWVARGDARETMREQRLWAIEERLTTRQRAVYEYAEEIAENGVHLSVKEAMAMCNLTRQKAYKTITQLQRKGLLKKCGDVIDGLQGGRPMGLYAPTLSSLAAADYQGFKRVHEVASDQVDQEVQGVQTQENPAELQPFLYGVPRVIGVQTSPPLNALNPIADQRTPSAMSVGDRVVYQGRPDFLVRAVSHGRVDVQHVSSLETHSGLLPGVDVFDVDAAILSVAPEGDEGEGGGVSVLNEQINLEQTALTAKTAKQPLEGTSVATPSARSSCPTAETAEQPTADSDAHIPAQAHSPTPIDYDF